ncbi:hypothetical protein [Sphingomonas bacterium]|uniref:hypothetical protein n=1 Tax=Sphingomonas bacterium TaxID=1895847 RepID=UPI001576583C|nr:hypothetical protein [Sphingomonas bacterium]
MTMTSRGLAPTLAAPTLAALVALGMAGPAVAKDKKPVDPDKKVCRSEVATGSRFAKTTCHTLAEWAQIDGTNGGDARTMLDRATRSGMAGMAGGGG